ncbi:MAG TPA: methyltransferase [Saprospiraceae bacterium]|nr:methyltransferase [Saprospiraceae bacterium]
MTTLADEAPEFFDWQGLKIFQHETVHKVGTDAVLLASWTALLVEDVPSFILDAGTGSGILALKMAKAFPSSKIFAVDIDQDALRLAAMNASTALVDHRIKVSYENMLAPPAPESPAYNLILCNPPFYHTTNLPDSEYKARAKHSSAPILEWMKGLQSRLAASGQLCIIVPSEAAAKWISAANLVGYHNQQRMDVFSFDADTKPKRTLLHFGKDLIKPTFSRIVIYSPDQSYTNAYLHLTGIQPGK